jgi:CRP-like cAMP-binding protein
MLAQVPLFADLPPRYLKHLADRMDEERFMEGASIVRYGDIGDTFYVIVEGEAKVLAPSGKVVNHLRPGEFFGEVSLLDGGPRTATVVAETPIRMLSLSRPAFRNLIETEPGVAVGMLKHASAMLRRLERPASG